MGKIVFGAIMPHPPILIPEIGKNRIKEARRSSEALETVSRRFKQKNIDTLIVVTPHGEVGQASVPVYTGRVFEGSFSQFGMPRPVYSYKGDADLAMAIVRDNPLAASSPETLLDHGALVPLYFIFAAGVKSAVLPVGIGFLPLERLFDFGRSLAKAVNTSGKNAALIASADMSHRLTPDAPSGYSPRGKEFDEKLVALVGAGDASGIVNFDPELAQEAGQDALWSIAILMGALDGAGAKPEVLSYEGPFGVGYMVAALDPQ